MHDKPEYSRFTPREKNIGYDDQEVIELCYEINRYCKRHFEFKLPNIASSIIQDYKDSNFLTAKQYNILIKIYYENCMHRMPDEDECT